MRAGGGRGEVMLQEAEEPLAVRYVLFCGGACFWEADGFATIEPQVRQLSSTFLAPTVRPKVSAAECCRGTSFGRCTDGAGTPGSEDENAGSAHGS